MPVCPYCRLFVCVSVYVQLIMDYWRRRRPRADVKNVIQWKLTLFQYFVNFSECENYKYYINSECLLLVIKSDSLLLNFTKVLFVIRTNTSCS